MGEFNNKLVPILNLNISQQFLVRKWLALKEQGLPNMGNWTRKQGRNISSSTLGRFWFRKCIIKKIGFDTPKN